MEPDVISRRQLALIAAGRHRAAALPPLADGRPLVVDLDDLVDAPPIALGTAVPHVVVGLASGSDGSSHPAADSCDVIVDRDDGCTLDALAATIERAPVAAASLAMLLRGSPHRGVDDGLLAESTTYSTLQAGAEFRGWRSKQTDRRTHPSDEPIRVERDGATLRITLDRPEVRNALDAATLDLLVDLFSLVANDPSITDVRLRGAGPSFCAGGDLAEFGSLPDPALAHLIRIERSVGRAIASVATKVTAELHGACAGSGVELPAFAGTVVAHPDTTLVLPELGMGLIPGAGGTVSISGRIGRHRTAELALTGATIDAEVARRWGLVDRIESA
jgi:hypothetical protein